ncbi:MAG: AbrB/MazE/SpoVT family DNA-binding domain-containing protein [Candidatus Omnitrophica bacterium]|nr:AbrB/MazE/SpoVT family DNA-binding domain-containing protein [Candidatus Omnitrophota bacterium]
MAFATMTSKGQMTIPKDIRQKLHLKPHDKLSVTTDGEKATLRPIRGTILGLKGIFKDAVKGPINFKELRRKFEEGMAEDAVRRGRLRPPKS